MPTLAPGERAPPELTVTGPAMLPEPPSVPPLLTVTTVLASEPLTRRVPAFTVVLPVYVFAPPRLRDPAPDLTSDTVPPVPPLLAMTPP